jgi:hypothetical protein
VLGSAEVASATGQPRLGGGPERRPDGSAPRRGVGGGLDQARTPASLSLHGFDQNQIWCQLVAMACELTAWMQVLA